MKKLYSSKEDHKEQVAKQKPRRRRIGELSKEVKDFVRGLNKWERVQLDVKLLSV